MGCCHSAAAVQPVNGAVEIDNLAEIPDDAADTNSTVSGSEEDARLTGPPDIEPGDAVTPVEIAPENNDIKGRPPIVCLGRPTDRMDCRPVREIQGGTRPTSLGGCATE